ncbi:MAG: four helix bundle protein [Gemmatimonadota bacterium]
MKSHRDLRAWQQANAVAADVFRWSNTHWSPQLGAVHDQLRRAALSVALNIVEGFASGPGARCRNHLKIAYGSAVETTAILAFLQELELDTNELTDRSRHTQALTLRLWQRSRIR